MYNQFGPTARICFELPKRKSHLNEYQHRFQAVLSSLLSVFQEMVTGIFNIDKPDISLTILLLKRLPGNDFSLPTVEVITPAAEMVVRDQLNKDSSRSDLFRLYPSLARVEQSRRLADIVYGMLAQESLLREYGTFRLQLYPMVRRTPDGSGPIKKLPRWYSNQGHGDIASFGIYPTGIDTFDPKAGPIKNNVYYKSYQAAFDSFIMVNNQLYIFQFTVATEHDVNKGILTFFSQASLPPRANWYFIFVIPSNLSEFGCPQGRGEMKEFLEEIHLYTMSVGF